MCCCSRILGASTEVNTQTHISRKISAEILWFPRRWIPSRNRGWPLPWRGKAGSASLHRVCPSTPAEESIVLKRSESGMIVDPVTISPIFRFATQWKS